MNGEERFGSDTRSEQINIGINLDDDEPIGSLLKLKRPQNIKRVKVRLEGTSKKGKKVDSRKERSKDEDETLWGMDDTLASFRKKLKVPRRDNGFRATRGRNAALNVVETSDRLSNVPVDDDCSNAKSISKIAETGSVICEDESYVTMTIESDHKCKGKVKRPRIDFTVKTDSGHAISIDVSESVGVGVALLEDQKKAGFWHGEGSSQSVDENMEDSLSSFVQRRSGSNRKSCSSSWLKQKAEAYTLENELSPSSVGASGTFQSVVAGRPQSANSSKEAPKNLKSEYCFNQHCASSPTDSALNRSKTVDNKQFDNSCQVSNFIEDDKHFSIQKSSMPDTDNMTESGDIRHDWTFEVSSEDLAPDPQLLESHTEGVQDEATVEVKDNRYALSQNAAPRPRNFKDGLKHCSIEKASRLQNVVSSPKQMEETCSYFDGPNTCIVEPNLISVSSQMEAAKLNIQDKLAESCTIPEQFPLGLHPNESVPFFQKSRFDVHQNLSSFASKDACAPSHDYLSYNEEANEASSPSATPDENESFPGNAISSPDYQNKNSLLAVQRVVRKPKKRRHGDMAYEGDVDWEVLIHGQGFPESHQVVDGDRSFRTRDKFDVSPNTVTNPEDGGAAAVTVGLKARAAGPVEKIKFKEVLKRKGGLQEYLECRNHILALWNKDVSRILPLADFGVSNAPAEDQLPRASLIRDVYAFLDQSGYINIGIASEKEKVEHSAKPNYELLKERKIEESSGASVADSEDGVSFILGQVKKSETSMEGKNSLMFDNENHTSESPNSRLLDTPRTLQLPTQHVDCSTNCKENSCIDANLPNQMVCPDIPNIPPEPVNDLSSVYSASKNYAGEKHHVQCGLEVKNRVIIIGAGPAGLSAARHLQRQGFSVVVLEARSRIGGRVFTDRSSLSVPVDLGASIITGVEADVATERRPDPSSLICAQLGLELTVLNSDCPLYDTVTGQKVPSELDEALEAEFNSLLDDMVLLVAQNGEHAMKMSLEDGLEYALKRRRMARLGKDSEDTEMHSAFFGSTEIDVESRVSGKKCLEEEILSPIERRVMDWHFANLEYGCASLLKEVSLPYWNQDDVYGGFGGAHCMIKGGYSAVVESLGEGLSIHLNHVVTDVSYSAKDSEVTNGQWNKVKVSTTNGCEFSGDAVLITVPLGCLKAEAIKFSPPLPQWKHSSIQRLGFGVLNKVVLEFSEVFWDDSVDYFGATADQTSRRGHCFMFWNIKKTVGAPILIALVVGKAAIDGQNMSSSDHVSHALTALRKLFGEVSVPDPVASIVTDWGRDPFSYGAYSYVAVGSSGEDYDILGRPIENCLFFAGEATCKEHPDTVGGAMMSGLREAVRIVDLLRTGKDYTAEVEAMEAAQRHSESERDEVRDIARRLDAVELSNVLYKTSLDGARILTKEALLQDMFFNAKTTAGRLHLAKELLNIPVETLKFFAGTREGLTTLNSWILDSMGKDGTQLLRHCVRLLVLVSTNLYAVRLSGIGKTVKEKVCVHTSRDIRAIASQLVSVWLEVFRKKKASNGGLKFLKQTTAVDSSRSKSQKDNAAAKLPLRTHNGAMDSKGSSQVSASPANRKNVNGKLVKVETLNDSKSEVNSSRSGGSVSRSDTKVGEGNNFATSEDEQAAFAAAEAARAAALAAAEAYASSGAKGNVLLQLPKIPSFHKFARREQYAQMDESDLRRKWSGGPLGRQDCISEIDSRNCRVRDWSVDFSAACVNLGGSRMSVDNLSQQSHSNEIACQLNFREHSGESAAIDSSVFTKAWVDTAGSVGIKDYHAIERWQSQAAASDSDFFDPSMHVRDEEDSNTTSKLPTSKHNGLANESSVSQVTTNRDLHIRGAENIKQAVVNYVASLLMPLYKARKIDKEGYKSIMKKTATKVMEQATDAEKAMTVKVFLDFKRRNKIRSFVDKLIERHMAVKPAVNCS